MRYPQPVDGFDDEPTLYKNRIDKPRKGVEDELPDEATNHIRDRPREDGNDPKKMPSFNLHVEEKGNTESDQKMKGDRYTNEDESIQERRQEFDIMEQSSIARKAEGRLADPDEVKALEDGGDGGKPEDAYEQ